MNRRTFIGSMVGGLLAVPLAANAQKPAMPVVGFLCTASPTPWSRRVAAFRTGLGEIGYAEGRNVAIEFRWAEGQYDRLPAMAADLVRRQVSVIAATGGTVAVLAAKAATSTIPIVFTLGDDPVKAGLVASLNRPGGNVTGASFLELELTPKRLGVLHELVPNATVVALLTDPRSPGTEPETKATLEAARALGLQLYVLQARTEADIDAAFTALEQQNAGALLIGLGAIFDSYRERLVTLSTRRRVPTFYFEREFVVAGGLASYGPNIADAYQQAGVYAGKILDGAKPVELPVLQPTKIDLVINLKTAKALGITIPQSLLLRADEVIQ